MRHFSLRLKINSKVIDQKVITGPYLWKQQKHLKVQTLLLFNLDNYFTIPTSRPMTLEKNLLGRVMMDLTEASRMASTTV